MAEPAVAPEPEPAEAPVQEVVEAAPAEAEVEQTEQPAVDAAEEAPEADAEPAAHDTGKRAREDEDDAAQDDVTKKAKTEDADHPTEAPSAEQAAGGGDTSYDNSYAQVTSRLVLRAHTHMHMMLTCGLLFSKSLRRALCFLHCCYSTFRLLRDALASIALLGLQYGFSFALAWKRRLSLLICYLDQGYDGYVSPLPLPRASPTLCMLW